jgi:hypothetical protein
VGLEAAETDRLGALAIAPEDYWRQRARLPWS